MNRLGRISTILSLCALTAVCNSSGQFPASVGVPWQASPYDGTQIWPVEKGSKPEAGFDLPVYRHWPEQPFQILNVIHPSGKHGPWDASDISMAVALAKMQNADALLLCRAADLEAVKSPEADPKLIPAGETAAFGIRWIPPRDVSDAAHRLDGFRAYLRRSYPPLRLEAKNELWKMGLEAMAWSGVDVDSERGAGRLEETFASLVAPPSAPSTRWLFKGIAHSTDPDSLPQRYVYGVAELTREGDHVSIVCKANGLLVQFDGVEDHGKLSGKLEWSDRGFKLEQKARGSLEEEAIRLEPAAPPAEGAPRAEFVFLR
ncbi:MAG TPA: hypothetical protein VGH90_12080 [Chthoniobacteraceae bacterium]